MKYEFGYCILAILCIFRLWTVFWDLARSLKHNKVENMLVEEWKIKIEPVFCTIR